MNPLRLLRCEWLILASLFLIMLVPGCGDDDSAIPEPGPDPKITMSLECNGGHIELVVRNSGGPMEAPSLFIAAFADGHSDTLQLSLDAGESIACRLSNIHGGVTVSNEEWSLEATTDDCLADYFEAIGTSFVLSDVVPSPLTQMAVLACTYTIYLRNLDRDNATFELIRTNEGLTLRYVYSNITADLAAISPGWLCPDLSGSIVIASIVVDIHVDIGDGDDPPVTLGGTEATVYGFQVNVEGTFGFIVEWITSWFEGFFTDSIEDALESAVSASAGTDLNAFVIVSSSCSE